MQNLGPASPIADEAFARWAVKTGVATQQALDAVRGVASASLLENCVYEGILPLDEAMALTEPFTQRPCGGGCGTTYEIGVRLVPFLGGVRCPTCGALVCDGDDERMVQAVDGDTTSMGVKHGETRAGPRMIGAYTVVGTLGFGGMAEVLLAEGPDEQRVAVKLLRAALQDDENHYRFAREARLLGELSHPNIVAVLGDGIDQTGRPYLVMEFVRGSDLEVILAARDTRKLTVEEASFVLLQCARALAHIHAKGVVHRDIKPSNVLMTPAGDVKLTDFGIATAGTLRLTLTGEILGTPGFVCPEAFDAKYRDWEPPADLYSLGALAFRLLAGRGVFVTESPALLLAAHKAETPERLHDLDPTIPEALSDLVGALLAKVPEGRPTAEEAAQVLEGLSPDLGDIATLRTEVAILLERRDPAQLVGTGTELKRGQCLGNYVIENEIGRGGMGVVYRAHHVKMNKQVAFKVLQGGTLASEEDRARFLREADSAGRLQHPNVVPILDAGVEGEISYLAMELVSGESLKDWAKGRSQEAVLRAFTAVCAGMHHAHSRGVIHRDLKSSNIVVDESGAPRILDFGIAKQIDDDSRTKLQTMTAEGSILGTLAYMPPEQAGGRVQEVDVRSDVYGLGSILYELLSGSTPFSGSVRELLHQIHLVDPSPPSSLGSDVPWELDAICLRALEKAQDDRYQSALLLKQDVERYLDGVPIHARKANVIYRLRKWTVRNRSQAITAVAAAVLIFSMAALLIGQLVVGEFDRRAQVIDSVVRGWKHATVGEFNEAAKTFEVASQSLRADDLLLLPVGPQDYLPPDVLEELSPADRLRPRLHRDRLDRWITYVDRRQHFEKARVLSLEAERALLAGDLEAAEESIERALLLRADDPTILQVVRRVAASLVERGKGLLASSRALPPVENEERGRRLWEAQACMTRGQKLDPTSADALSGLAAVHRELGKLSGLGQAGIEMEQARKRAGELVAEARRVWAEAQAGFLARADPDRTREQYYSAIEALKRALFLVREHPEALECLRQVSAEFAAVLVEQGQPELSKFILKLGGVPPDESVAFTAPRDPHLTVLESGGPTIRQVLGGDSHFKPTHAFEGLREWLTRFPDLRVEIDVRSSVERGATHPTVCVEGLWIRLVNCAKNTVSPPTKVEFEGGPYERRVSVDSGGRRLVGSLEECATLDVERQVERVEEIVKRLVKEARQAR